MAALPVNFKDDILAESMGGKRRYNIIQNDDGTISLEDVTQYAQEGSNFGAAQVNATNGAVNGKVELDNVISTLEELQAVTEPGFWIDALVEKSLYSKNAVMVKRFQKSITVPSSGNATMDIDVTVDGYTAIGVIGYSAGDINILFPKILCQNNILSITARNLYSNSLTKSPVFDVLYVKS